MKVLILTRKKMVAILLILVFIVTAATVGFKGYTVATTLNNKKLPIYCVETEKNYVCLTFDAAWGNEDTQDLIDILKKYNAKATFFIVGEWVDKYPESVKALSKAGHSIQNHSDTHANLSNLSREDVLKEIKECNEKVEKITGKCPTLIRPPYGDYNNQLIECATNEKMHTIQWDVDSLDWKDKSAEEISKKVTSKVTNGSIVLFHNAALNTPKALPEILEKLQKENYKFVTVENLIYKDNFKIDHTGKQIKIDAATTSKTAKTEKASTTSISETSSKKVETTSSNISAN